MAKKTVMGQNITHTEIYSLAISAIDARIEEWREKSKNMSDESFFLAATEELRTKRDTLKMLYFIETGVKYE